jgi:two-component system NtrC family response regulator
VPPLRERLEDIPILVEHLVQKHAARNGKSISGLDEGILTSLRQYHWPGNVRELENTIERAVVLTSGSIITCDAVTVEAMVSAQSRCSHSLRLRENIEWIEYETIRQALAMSPQKQHAARIMGITPRALSHYLTKYPTIEMGNHSRQVRDRR